MKRLKRGHKEEREDRPSRDARDLFDSDEDEEINDYGDGRRVSARAEDEFADFIEEDFSDGEGRDPAEDDAEVSRMVRGGLGAMKDTAGLDEGALEDFRAAFGDGEEYDWALELQDQEEDDRKYDANGEPISKGVGLKDVFEPSQLAEKLLTDEDDRIRDIDEPERFQIARAPYKDLVFTKEQAKEEAGWIAKLMLPKKRLPPHLWEPFQNAVGKVLEFMNTDEYEVPFIFQHRKDYLIHAVKDAVTPDPDNPNAPEYVVNAEKLLDQSDLWDIFDHDLKFRALIEKRNALQRTYDNLKGESSFQDAIFEEMLPIAETMEELQDVQDYLYFQHSARLADVALVNGMAANGTQKRPGAGKMLFEKIRSSKVYGLVRAFGTTADAVAQNYINDQRRKGRRQYTEDPGERPDQMAASEDILDPPEYPSGTQCLRAARAMFAEELFVSPRMRKVLREAYYLYGIIGCFRTDKGVRKIDEQHPYYEFKYLRNQRIVDFVARPGQFLRMLKAEEEGLVEVRVEIENIGSVTKSLYGDLESDNFSEVADAWNRERRTAMDMALMKLHKTMAKGVKENLKARCESEVAQSCREKFSARLDQAPYKPKGMMLGTVPRVLALTNGSGTLGRDPIYWAFCEDDGRALENGKFVDFNIGDPERNSKDGPDLDKLIDLIVRRKPDVLGVSGFSAETRKLVLQLKDIVAKKDLRGADFEDDDGRDNNELLEVIIVNDEIARLYQTSSRANAEYPSFAPLTRYCVALARYLQDPMREYATLGRDLISISFDPNQTYVAQDKIVKSLETAMVDLVNLCGVDINEAASDLGIANFLPYVCGLGPRKAQHMLKVINMNGGMVSSRAELVGDVQVGKLQAVGPRVWNNCASFLYLEFDSSEPESDYLDNTRVHPEDYDLGRKMAADALELDEEDIQAEQQENGPGAIIRKLIKDDAQEKVNDLILEEYAEQLERNFNQRKRATLETIRAELQMPYEELRRNFETELSTNEIFTMFTGETLDSLCEGMIVPMSIKRVSEDFLEGKLDCGVDGTITNLEMSDRMNFSAKESYALHQMVQAKILVLNRKKLHAEMSLLEEKLQVPFRREHFEHMGNEWDVKQEREDKDAMQEKNDVSGRTQRVIKHPLFRSFNTAQAEEYLGSQSQGDVIIRPSSKGLDHLAVTWKVADGVYQHIDVLELDKDNEFAVGKLLKIGGRWTYSDLDELIVDHVKAMARKVDEMMLHEKYKSGTRGETGMWP